MKALKVTSLLQLFLTITTTTTLLTASSSSAQEEIDTAVRSNDYFCGTNWPNAATTCSKSCPTGNDSECSTVLGINYGCFYFTGCRAKIESGDISDPDADGDGDGDGGALVVTNEGEEEEGGGTSGTSGGAVANGQYCGQTWLTAMLSCNTPCPTGTECSSPGQRCFAATNCDKPLERLTADMLVTLLGPDSTMDNADGDILGLTIHELLSSIVEEEGVALDEVNLGKQSVATRRELVGRYNRRRGLKGYYYSGNSKFAINHVNVTQRILQSGSSALDVSMVITGDYRPPPYLDLNVIAEDSINRQGSKVVDTLRERGGRAGRTFFERVDGIEAVARGAASRRPTNKPTPQPSYTPTVGSSDAPSFPPSYEPTSFPTSSPNRAHDQAIITGSQQDLQLGGTTTSSYGYIFNIRTRPGAGVVMVNGFDFYTESVEDVNFELWSRNSGFQDYKGIYDGWDLIAEGSVKGRGIGRYTTIPEEFFTPVHIPGDGGTRAFYLTLTDKQLVYKVGTGSGSDAEIQMMNEDIEIWEGESVLSYPFPSVEDAFYYRFPRRLLGGIRYDRMPCKPCSLYGTVFDWPCPDVPTQTPTIPPPTRTPVTSPPSTDPTAAPIGTPTFDPSISRSPQGIPTGSPTNPVPTQHPSTANPTTSPIIPERVNVVAIFRNVPSRDMTSRETEKYLEIMTSYLRKHTELQMVIEGIDLWHHKIVMVDAEEDTEEGSSTSTQVSRGTKGTREGNEKEDIPQITAVEITMIVRISLNTLPSNLLGNLISVTIEENEAELLSLLNEQSAFYSYFKEMDGVNSYVIDIVTNPPTLRPTTLQEYLNNQQVLTTVEVLEESEEGTGIMVFVGVGIGVLWCCLTVASIAYLMRRRAELQEQHDMEDLLRQEKANPLGNGTVNENDGSNEQSRPTHGGEDDPDRDDEEVGVTKDLKESSKDGNDVSMTSQSAKKTVTRGSTNITASSSSNGERKQSRSNGVSRSLASSFTRSAKRNSTSQGALSERRSSQRSSPRSNDRISARRAAKVQHMSRSLASSFSRSAKQRDTRKRAPSNEGGSDRKSSTSIEASKSSSLQGSPERGQNRRRSSQLSESDRSTQAGRGHHARKRPSEMSK